MYAKPQLGATLEELQNLPTNRTFSQVAPFLPLMWVETPPVTVTGKATAQPQFGLMNWLSENKTAVLIAVGGLAFLAFVKASRG